MSPCKNQVERRLAELKNVNEMATRGRLKSQRGGPGDIAVKKLIDWPQNFILTGAHKTRPTYDDLTITQWVSGFVRCIQEEKSGNNRELMLDYLGNLMEDASNFSWDSAKAAHDIYLLTWRLTGLSGRKPTKSIGYIELMLKDILVTIKLLPHALLLKNKKNLAIRLVSIVGSSRKEIANILLITKLLVFSSDMFVKIVMEPIFQKLVLKKIIQKTSSSK